MLLDEHEGVQLDEFSILTIATAIGMFSPCNLLVFGVGNDTPVWLKLNSGGRTVFLEDDPEWISEVQSRCPQADIRRVEYTTLITQWERNLDMPERLEFNHAEDWQNIAWDVIFVDAPKGFMMVDHDPEWGTFHGRMQSIFAASKQMVQGACVFVDDAERPLERAYCDRFLGVNNMIFDIRRTDSRRLRCYSAAWTHRPSASVRKKVFYLQCLALLVTFVVAPIVEWRLKLKTA
jgi:hypothetical protein